MKKQQFSQLKKLWGLDQDTSIVVLLEHAQNKLQEDPGNPELSFNVAELLRHENRTDEAKSLYQNAVKLTDQRTQQRAENLEHRVKMSRDHTRAKFLLFTFVPLIILALIAGLAWKILSVPEPLPKESDPEQFAFTRWLAKQQMVEIMTTLQQQNPELSFDFSQPVGRQQSPMEFMQSLMRPDAIQRLKRDKERAANKNNNDGDGRPEFQCSREPRVSCSARDIPSAAGERRTEVVALMDAYNTILESERDCEKIEKSIETIGEQLQWRKSERRIKATLEDFAVECYFRKKNLGKTLEHARKLQCSGDVGYVNSVYWYLTAIHHQNGQIDKAKQAYQCYQEATVYVEKNDFSPAYVASRHRESGALAWLYFDDLATATAELKRGRTILKNIPLKTPVISQVISEINLDLMETYVTADVDAESFDDLLEEINSSGLLTDGYKQIKDTLAAIYLMQNKRNKEAVVPLNTLVSRFKLMPEFICGWDWSGFKRGLSESISDSEIRQKAVELVDAANCYESQTIKQRIKNINTVQQWLQRK
jgi:tetratricopeptide (TPR) repeat protein